MIFVIAFNNFNEHSNVELQQICPKQFYYTHQSYEGKQNSTMPQHGWTVDTLKYGVIYLPHLVG